MWCVPGHTSNSTQPGRPRQEDGKAESSMGYTRPYLIQNRKMHVWMAACQEMFRQVFGKGFGPLQQSLCSGATLTCMEPISTPVA